MRRILDSEDVALAAAVVSLGDRHARIVELEQALKFDEDRERRRRAQEEYLRLKDEGEAA